LDDTPLGSAHSDEQSDGYRDDRIAERDDSRRIALDARRR